MSELTHAAAEREALANRFRHVRLGFPDRVAEGLAPAQAGGNRRRERASGAVRIGRLDARRHKSGELTPVPQEIQGVALEMPALDQDVSGAKGVDAPRRLF